MPSNLESLQELSVALLDPHPDNPRLFFREEIINAIASQIQANEDFDAAHALIVRPLNGRYQILQGHHRWKAALIAGVETIPCWIREMPDDEAYMLLALGNVQGELSPLEIGIHALRAVELADGGRGVKGGASAYAEQLGKTHQYVTQTRQAAEVFRSIKHATQVACFLDKAKHLAAVYKTPQDMWQVLVDWFISKDKSVNQVETAVKELRKFDVPDSWQKIFLPLDSLAANYLEKESPTPETASGLILLAEMIEQLIIRTETDYPNTFTYTTETFHKWLRTGIGTYAWQEIELQIYWREMQEAAIQAAQPRKPDVHQGEWYQLGRHTLYCGDTGKEEFWKDLLNADFAFADPPYNAETADWDSGFIWRHDWLIDRAPIVAVTPGIASIQSFFRERTQMPYRWSMAVWIDNGRARGELGFGNWIYVALFARENLHRNSQDIIRCSLPQKDERIEFKGQKPQEMMRQIIELFTNEGQVIIDPFLGSGTTLLEAEKMNRICVGGELNEVRCNAIIDTWQNMTGQSAERI